MIKLSEVGPNIVLPAGLRAVKDVLYVLPAIMELKQGFDAYLHHSWCAERSVLQEVEKVIKKSWIKLLRGNPVRRNGELV
ncbi:hypothetical protein KHA80_20650 [Anaerobacillus sp. HL2]|nr:hypothetical protein KHA80_20650 [Anaerobacillus sp. HL2]